MRFFQKKVWIAGCMALAVGSFAAGMATQYVGAETKGRLVAKSLMKQELHNIDGKELLVIELNLEPGAGSPPHSHPGHVAGYVIEGSFEVQLNDEEPNVFGPGDVFYEPDGAVHTMGRNPSATESTKVVVFMIAQEGEPITKLHTH